MYNNISYNYQKPQNTATLDQFISCKSDTVMSYHNISFQDKIDNINYDTYNIIGDYIEEIKSNSLLVNLTDEQFFRYKYRPKLLCYDIYNNGELAFIILAINDMYSVKQFCKKRIYMPNQDEMKTIVSQLFNSNKDNIDAYNKNKT